MTTQINLLQLAKEIRTMNSRKKLYRVLKDELQALGHWKDLPRGDAKKGYQAMQNKIAQD